MTAHELQQLVGQQQPPCVSIYLPTHRNRPGTEQDRIRFKNLVSQAAGLLREKYRGKDVDWFLAPVEGLSTTEFWQHQEDGLAVCCCPGTCLHYRLPLAVPEIAVVSDTFHVKPIVGFLNSNRHYFVLALSKKEVKLYEGSSYGLGQIALELLQKELRGVMGEIKAKAFFSFDIDAKEIPITASKELVVSNKIAKREVFKYFRAIDRALWPILRDERAPLVLAGVGYLHSLFREACRYPYLLDKGIEGNVARMPLESLREAAGRLVSSYETESEGALLNEYVRALKSGRASSQISDLAKAVVHGRVRVLLHEAGKTIWGRLGPETGDITVHEHQQQQDAKDADIIDDLCELTILKGGEVFEISAGNQLVDSPLAAIYRY